MKKFVIIGLVSLSVVAGSVLALWPSGKMQNSSAPSPAGNGNCTYANGVVRLCPVPPQPPVLYTSSMTDTTPITQNTQPSNNPTPPADPAATPVASPSPAPPTDTMSIGGHSDTPPNVVQTSTPISATFTP